MPIPMNTRLYEKVKKMANKTYKKPSAYKSGYIVKTYKKLGGLYQEDNKTRNLKRWFQEKWTDVGHKKYPVYRPTLRINKKTPKIVSELDNHHLKKQISLKQRIKGNKNLPPFQ